jgi:capsular polysaccharide transport system permease protein
MNARTPKPVENEGVSDELAQRLRLRQRRLEMRERQASEEGKPEPEVRLPIELRRPALHRVDATETVARFPEPDRPATAPQQPLETTPAPVETAALGARIRSWGFVRVWFVLAVLLPVVASAIYLWGFASDRFVSEFKFSVKSQEFGIGTMGKGSAATASAAGGGGAAKYMAFFDTYVVTDYINSKQAVRDIMQTIDLRRIFSDSAIDRFSRLTPDASFEDIYRYWRARVSADFDMLTGTGIVTVQGFSPDDARKIAERLLQLSEKLINDTMARVRGDNLKFVEDQVRNAEMRLQMARKMVHDFRVNQRIVDPTVDVGQSQVLVGKLTEQLTELTSQLAALRPHLSRDAPTIVVLQSRIKAVEDQLMKAKADMGTMPMLPQRERAGAAAGASANGGAQEAMANRFDYYAQQLGVFQTLQTDLELATQNYQSMMQFLESTRQAAIAQHSYVLAYVRPDSAETAAYPERFRTLFIVMVLASLFWVVTVLLGYSVRDHIA